MIRKISPKLLGRRMFSLAAAVSKPPGDKIKATTAEAATKYSVSRGIIRYSWPLRVMHSAQALGVVGALAAVTYALQQPKTPEGNKNKADAMFYHKSLGTFVFGTIPFRLYFRTQPFAAPALPGSGLKIFAAQLVHGGLYGGILFMTVTGLLMTFYSGKGLPFFVTKFDNFKSDPVDGKSAGYFYKIHKKFGYYWQLLVPLHVAGGVFSSALGLKAFARMNPFM